MSAPRFKIVCRRDREHAWNDLEDVEASYPANKVALIDCDNPRHKEFEALFCAAPELLAACELVIDQGWVGEETKAYEALRAAIAKAKSA